MIHKAINEAEILDEIIHDLRDRAKATSDFDERIKLDDRLMKAVNMRLKLKASRKGKGFNLDG